MDWRLGLVLFLDLLYPDGRRTSASWRWFAAIVLQPAAILAVLSPGLILSSTLNNPLGVERLPNASKAVEAFMYALVVVSSPIAMGIAIFRYRLYQIDILINRTLVYGPLPATLVALYFAVIVVLQSLLVVLIGEQSTLAVWHPPWLSPRCLLR
jgi:hypothetical protein